LAAGLAVIAEAEVMARMATCQEDFITFFHKFRIAWEGNQNVHYSPGRGLEEDASALGPGRRPRQKSVSNGPVRQVLKVKGERRSSRGKAMATGQMSEVMQHLRRAVLLRDGAGLTDGQLLEDYLRRQDEAALAALVRRHGPMVWGVCRRVLRNYHDAEDAFQATFLVLVRKASSIVPRELVANWL